jgi:putative ABC transport system permease protein
MTFLSDLRYAIRLLFRTPSFAVVSILTLALGIGANTAIFTVVNALLLRPLPYPDADRLVMVWQDLRARGGPADEWATPGNYADWRQEKGIFQQVAVISGWRPTLTGAAEPEPISGEQVSHEYFPVLRTPAAIGRTFTQADDVPNAARVVVIGHGLWQRRFGGSATVVGQSIPLSGEAHEIIGVLPDGFRPIVNRAAEIWRPLRLNTGTPSRGAIILRAVARLPEGVPLSRAQADADILAARLEAAYPDYNEKTRFNLMPLHERVVGDIRPGLLAMLGAVGFVLLIACANIANLLLARGSARSRELAVRVALGAGRGRVIRQLLTESVMLAILGGIGGLLIGAWAVDALVSLAPSTAPRLDEIGLDGTVFVYTAVLTLATGVLFGLAPALQHSRGEVTGTLKESGRGSSGAAGQSLRRALIAAEVALALMLLTGAGLLAQTFSRLTAADLGFRPENVIAGSVNPPRAAGYDTPAKRLAFYDQVFERVSALPGVERAAMASVLPLTGGDSDTSFAIEGRAEPTRQSDTPVTWYRLVSASYFETMGIPLKRGRTFETREAARTVAVNETFVSTYFRDRDPIGQRVRFGGPDAPWFTIAGVVGDVRVSGARGDTRVETYIPYWHMTEPGMTVILKAAGDPALLAAPLRRAVAAIDRNVPVSGITTLDALVGESIENPRFFATLSGAFAAFAVLLAAIGIYGVMAYAVSLRTTEIGVRMALGATPREVFRLIVGDGLRLTAIGIALGIAGSLVIARWLAALLFGVSAGDPATLGTTATVLLVVAAAACFLPARRATRVDPMVALRAE